MITTQMCQWCGLDIVPDGERWADGDGVTYCLDAERFHKPKPPRIHTDTGLIIDCSHLSALDLDRRIVRYAAVCGYDYANKVLDETPPFIDATDQEVLDTWTYRSVECLDWLNDNVAADGHAYHIEDNSLYHWPIEEEQ